MSSPLGFPEDVFNIPDVVESPSMFGDKPALWVNGKEIAHPDAEDVFDVRLTRTVISALRPLLKPDPRVKLRPSSSSDWVEVTIGAEEDIELLVRLVERAAAVHRAAPGQTAGLPPTGAALERRRRFH